MEVKGKDTLEFESGSTQVTWAQHSEFPIAIIAFRGTEGGEVKDLLTDLAGLRVKYSGGPEEQGDWGAVHSGFLKAFRSVATELIWGKLSALKRVNGEKVQVWATGHSLGGGLATIQSTDLLKRIGESTRSSSSSPMHWFFRGAYTFGSPRVGNLKYRSKFAELAEKRRLSIVRFVNGGDIVSRVPPLRLSRYRHIGYLAYLNGHGLVHGSERAAIGDSSYGKTRISAGDHSMTKYLDGIRNAIHVSESNPSQSAELLDCPGNRFGFQKERLKHTPFYME